MHDECLICKAPLVYQETDELMECELCHKKQNSKTRCVNGHFVCDECHTRGMDEIISICLNSESADPVEIMEQMMSIPACHMHGPEHHTMVGSALLTSYKNAGGEVDLKSALYEMQVRGKQVPGGVCGFWGACGAGVSTGMYVSIALKATPLSEEAWGLSNQMTAKALDAIGKNGGPRCCKRDSYLSIMEAVKFTSEHLGVNMDLSDIRCTRSHMNNQCLCEKCQFHDDMGKNKPKVAFVCVHNSCRSQIAEALGKKLAADVFESYSAGTEIKDHINPDAVRIMKEMHDIDMEATQYNKLIEDIPKPDIVVTMGCNVVCPYIPGSSTEDWGLDDPTGKPDEEFERTIRLIEKNILRLREGLL